ncbi:MAG: hypothetical protein U9N14_06760, partial [Pseudomonadota bacterium]|nr:hypothetical protein [Pseudomonadota bacterium]
MTDDRILRYAIYTRQSADRPEVDLSSCEVQKALCADIAETMPGTWRWVGEHFDDVGHSGAAQDRQAPNATVPNPLLSREFLQTLRRAPRPTPEYVNSF